MKNIIKVKNRTIGRGQIPLVIAEAGINHNGDIDKALKMVDDAFKAGCECIKFQCHIIEDEMIPNKVVPGNARESIWDIMKRCALSEREERHLKEYVDSRGMIFLSTPFSRAAADRLNKMGVEAFKVGSGECNNYPLIEHICGFGKPVILSTGMNDLNSVRLAVNIIEKYMVPYALLHCTSIYPTPYSKVRLGSLTELRESFPTAIIGLSDHSFGNYTSYAAVALGASIVEKHFTSNKRWHGPDISISIGPDELRHLIGGSRAIFDALKGKKEILAGEKPTIDFAYACVVSIKDIEKGEKFSEENIWVKRPGTGEIKAAHFKDVIGKEAKNSIPRNKQIKLKDIV